MRSVNSWLEITIVAFCAALFLSTACPAASEVVLICNKDVPDAALSRDDVQQIFLGRKTRWSDGGKITFGVLKGGDVHEAFLRTFLSKTDSQFAMFWKKMVFTGKGRLPASFDTPEDLRDYVAATPGAVGYVPIGVADGSVNALSIQ